MKKWFNWILLIFLIVVTSIVLFQGQDPKKIINVIKTISLKFTALAVVSMMLYLLLEALMLYQLTNVEHKLCSPLQAIKSMFIGQFYSLITPFASGGQPMQLLAMVQDGIKASHATAVLINKFLYFQIGVTIYSLVLFVLNWSQLVKYLKATYGLIAVGVIFNTVGLAIIIMTIFRPKQIAHLVNFLAKTMLAFKISPSKVTKLQNHWLKEIDEFSYSIQLLLANPSIIFRLSLLTLIQLTAYFGITYFIYRAFGQYGKSFVEIIALQSILYMSISLIPAPGSAGVAEGGFVMVFKTLFPPGSVTSAVLVWRGVTYYITLLVSGVMTIIATTKRAIQKANDLPK